MVGMSPKKAHEVTRMAVYVAFIAQKLRVPNGVYIVDVGAGQGHLARELLDVVPSVRGVLALDGDAVLVEKQTNARPKRGWANLKGKDYDVDGIDRGDATQVTHKFCRVSSSEKLIEAVDEWFVEMETSEVLRSDVPKPVILISLHGCGSLSLDVLRACVGNSDGTEEFVQRSKRKWGFIASVTVPCCYNLLRDGEYPLCAPSSSLSSHPESCDLTSKKIGIETVNTTVHPAIADCTPSVSASLAVRKVVWRALLECDNSSKLGFIPPMEANAYIQGGTNIKDLDPSLSSTSTSHSGKTGSNLEQGRLGKIGRFPSRAYDSWATFLGMAEARLGVDLTPSLAPLARALSIFHVLRCILGPLVESALLEDRVQWVRGQLVAHRPRFPTAEGQEQEVKLVKTNVEMGYEASLVPLFSQLGEAGSARNIAVVVVPKYLSG
ncbi:hypothetical protein EV359DRAFT_43301 [Lentinula novae-zelandiae]|nr:hypothetical protein EV359DRAFT_43301 [Lentinula novae-zelandiae]